MIDHLVANRRINGPLTALRLKSSRNKLHSVLPVISANVSFLYFLLKKQSKQN